MYDPHHLRWTTGVLKLSAKSSAMNPPWYDTSPCELTYWYAVLTSSWPWYTGVGTTVEGIERLLIGSCWNLICSPGRGSACAVVESPKAASIAIEEETTNFEVLVDMVFS